MSDPITALGREVHASLEDARTARGASEAVRQRLEAGELRLPTRTSSASKRPVIVFGVAAAAALALVAGSLAVGAREKNQPISFRMDPGAGDESGFLTARETPRPVHFSDGSEIVLAPHAQARVVETNARGARVVLERGSAEVRVKHQEQTSWQFAAGPYRVDVIGTAFTLGWSPETNEATVRMHEGSVRVHGCDMALARPLVSGDTLTVRCDPASGHSSLVRSPNANAAEPAASAMAASPVVPKNEERVTAPARPAVPHANGVATSAVAAANNTEALDELWTEGRSARARGDVGEARKLRLEFRKRFPRDERARVAAFELGQLAFDVDGDLAEANAWFSTYLRETPNGALAREAMGRAMEARHKLGDFQGSRSLARSYLNRFAGGPHDSLARELTGAGAGQ